MSKEREYEELYDRLLREVSTLHRNNRRRIRIGMKMLVAVTVGLMLLMFLSQGNKIFSLMLWIFSMFAVAAYLIAVEYADYELQKKLEYITQMQQQSMGALLMLPELPEVPKVGRLLRRETAEPDITIDPVSAIDAVDAVDAVDTVDTVDTVDAVDAVDAIGPAAADEPEEPKEPDLPEIPEPITFEQYFAEDITFDDPPAGEPSAPKHPAEEPAAAAGDDALRRLLSDPAQLAADLEALTHALQGLSETLRRSAGDARKEDRR